MQRSYVANERFTSPAWFSAVGLPGRTAPLGAGEHPDRRPRAAREDVPPVQGLAGRSPAIELGRRVRQPVHRASRNLHPALRPMTMQPPEAGATSVGDASRRADGLEVLELLLGPPRVTARTAGDVYEMVPWAR